MNKGIDYYQPNQKSESLSILQRIARTDKSAVKDCVDTYGSLVWSAARKYTDSIEKAEETTLKIFKEIWKRAPQYDSTKCAEEKFILRVILRQLIKGQCSNAKDCRLAAVPRFVFKENPGMRKNLMQI